MSTTAAFPVAAVQHLPAEQYAALVARM